MGPAEQSGRSGTAAVPDAIRTHADRFRLAERVLGLPDDIPDDVADHKSDRVTDRVTHG